MINFIKPTRENIKKVEKRFAAARLKNENTVRFDDCWLDPIVAHLMELGYPNPIRPEKARYAAVAGGTTEETQVIFAMYAPLNEYTEVSLDRVEKILEYADKVPEANRPVFDGDKVKAPYELDRPEYNEA